MHVCACVCVCVCVREFVCGAAKAAIDSLTRSYGLEWSEFGIRTIGLAPGPIGDTAGMTKLGAGVDESLLLTAIPLQRLGRKWDIGMAAVFCATPAASFITGTTIVV